MCKYWQIPHSSNTQRLQEAFSWLRGHTSLWCHYQRPFPDNLRTPHATHPRGMLTWQRNDPQWQVTREVISLLSYTGPRGPLLLFCCCGNLDSTLQMLLSFSLVQEKKDCALLAAHQQACLDAFDKTSEETTYLKKDQCLHLYLDQAGPLHRRLSDFFIIIIFNFSYPPVLKVYNTKSLVFWTLRTLACKCIFFLTKEESLDNGSAAWISSHWWHPTFEAISY